LGLPQFAFIRGSVVPYSEAKIGVMTHALNYGTAVFAGVRAYWNADRQALYLFRPLDHFQRFLNSCRLMRMTIDLSPEQLLAATLDLLHAENYQRDIYIRLLDYKSDEIIGVRLHGLHDDLAIFAVPFDQYVDNDTDAHVTISSWRRVDDNAIPARGKISGAYVNSALIKSDAQLAGFDEAIVLNQDGHVSEGSAENIFIVRGGTLVTPPVTDNILEGITRRSIVALAQKELGIPVVERSIDRTELYLCDELFLTGTAAQITAVTRIDHRPIGSGQMGPLTTQLRTLFYDVLRGCNPRYEGWNIKV
jgi:branched-chain amino acid aminotransferase